MKSVYNKQKTIRKYNQLNKMIAVLRSGDSVKPSEHNSTAP